MSLMSSLELDCWIYGRDADTTFLVKILKTESVSDLKKLIKNENPVDCGHIDAAKLLLYSVQAPSDPKSFDAMLNGWKPEGREYLNPRQRLSHLNLSEKFIIAHSPDLDLHAARPLIEMTIICCVRGEGRNRAFPVEISPTKASVWALKKLIKNKKPVGFGHVDANMLDIYRVSNDTPDVDEAMKTIDLNQPMLVYVPLAQYFSTPPPEGRIHIVVDVPFQVVPQKRSLEESDVPSPKRVEFERAQFLSNNKLCAPSIAGQPTDFLHRQNNSRTTIPCGRPRTTAATIPATLLHSSFGQFITDCMTLEVTPDDEAFAMQLSTTMSDIYYNESKRASALRDLFVHNGFHSIDISGQYPTDGVISIDDSPYHCVISEFKNEVGSAGVEPYFQAISHYLEKTRKLALNGDPLPCILLLLFGPWITFAGAVWNLCPTVQILSNALSMHYHPTDTWAQATVARHLGAFRNAVQTLTKHYQNLPKAPNPSPKPQLFPYPTSFTSLWDQSKRTFKYTSQPFDDKLLFFGEITEPEDQSPICIKFVRRYSKEAHEKCLTLGHAPALHGYEELPGGWWMVVMEQMSARTHQWLRDIKMTPELLCKIKAFVKKLHDVGYVHGDIRDANIMASIPDQSKFVLLDFDWAGKIGEVRYPIDLNKFTVWRPQDAMGGGIIKVEHDNLMVGRIR